MFRCPVQWFRRSVRLIRGLVRRCPWAVQPFRSRVARDPSTTTRGPARSCQDKAGVGASVKSGSDVPPLLTELDTQICREARESHYGVMTDRASLLIAVEVVTVTLTVNWPATCDVRPGVFGWSSCPQCVVRCPIPRVVRNDGVPETGHRRRKGFDRVASARIAGA